MPLIIDCYNLLHQPMPPSLAGLDEGRLCRLISASAWAGEGATVVCDGSPKPGIPPGTPAPGVRLVYSGPRRTADDVIRAIVHKSSTPRRLTVVSNDREVRQAARRRRSRVMLCAAFIAALAAPAAAPHAQGAKPSVATDGMSVEHWAHHFGLDPHKPLDEQDW